MANANARLSTHGDIRGHFSETIFDSEPAQWGGELLVEYQRVN